MAPLFFEAQASLKVSSGGETKAGLWRPAQVTEGCVLHPRVIEGTVDLYLVATDAAGTAALDKGDRPPAANNSSEGASAEGVALSVSPPIDPQAETGSTPADRTALRAASGQGKVMLSNRPFKSRLVIFMRRLDKSWRGGRAGGEAKTIAS